MITQDTPETPVAGSMIAGRYELCGALAQGGMGAVYRGWDHRLCRPVAVKRTPLAVSSDGGPTHTGEQARTDELWWWEAQVMAAVRHPHVVRVYDAIRSREHGYLIMELVEGTDLKHYLERHGPLPYADVLGIGIQMCRALHALHTRGLIHCDVKPHNILRGSTGSVKLADFGIAKPVGTRRQLAHAPADPPADASNAASGIVLGTATYCSPEQALCDPLTAATDVYSLGVVLYELLVGAPPFVGKTPLKVMTQHTVAPVPALRRLRPDIPPVIEEVIVRALAKNPAQRYASAQAMCEGLECAWAVVSPRESRPSGDGQENATIGGESDSQHALPARRWDAERSMQGGREWDEETGGATGRRAVRAAPNVAHRTSRRGSSRPLQFTSGISVALLCIADVLGLLLLVALLSWIH